MMLMRKAKSWFTGYNSNVDGPRAGHHPLPRLQRRRAEVRERDQHRGGQGLRRRRAERRSRAGAGRRPAGGGGLRGDPRHERHRLYAGPARGLDASARLLACRRRQGHEERAHRRPDRPRARPVAHPAGHGRRHAVARGALQRRDRAEGGGRRAAAPGGAARLRDGHRRVQCRGRGDRCGVGQHARQALPGHDPGPGFGPDRSAGQGRDRGRSDLRPERSTPPRERRRTTGTSAGSCSSSPSSISSRASARRASASSTSR